MKTSNTIAHSELLFITSTTIQTQQGSQLTSCQCLVLQMVYLVNLNVIPVGRSLYTCVLRVPYLWLG